MENEERQANSSLFYSVERVWSWSTVVFPREKSSLGHILEEIWLLASSWDLKLLLHLSTQLLCNYVIMKLQGLSDVCSEMYALVSLQFKGTVSSSYLGRSLTCSCLQLICIRKQLFKNLKSEVILRVFYLRCVKRKQLFIKYNVFMKLILL